jgi:hypothetical protein
MDSKSEARSGLTIFFLVLITGSAYFEHKLLVLGGSIQNHLGLIFGLVWWVTVSSLVARLVLHESPRDVSFRWGGWAGTRAILVAAAMPLAVGFSSYGIAWKARSFPGLDLPSHGLEVPLHAIHSNRDDIYKVQVFAVLGKYRRQDAS